MSRHASRITTAVFLSAVGWSVSAIAQSASPPDFAPNPSVGWYNYSRQFMPPPSGPGPVVQDPEHPFVTNDEFRVTGRQPTQQLADLSNPILQPWTRDVIRKRNELVLAGKLSLMAAMNSFDSERVLAFSTFAVTRIRGAIID